MTTFTQFEDSEDEESCEVGDFVSQFIGEQIEMNGELAERFCWICEWAVSESVEDHVLKNSHRHSVKKLSNLNYCGVCHRKYYFSKKDHLVTDGHKNSGGGKSSKNSRLIPQSELISVNDQSLEKFPNNLQHESLPSYAVLFEFWWHSPRSFSKVGNVGYLW